MKELEKFLFELNEKVKGKKGEIVFCLREFQFDKRTEGCFAPPETTEISYYETGIINGELQKYDKKEIQYESINFPVISLEHQSLDELILGEYSISVNKKFKGFFIHQFHKSFQFEIKDLEEQLKQGQLSMNSGELAKAFSVSEIFYPGSKDSDLKDFHLLIGDKEVENFVKEKEINNYQELVNVLKNQRYVEDIIIKHYNDEGEKIAKRLVTGANEIANNFREIQSLEASAMNAHLIEDWDADGKRINAWDKENLVSKYYKLKKEISNQIENKLDKYLEKGSKINKRGLYGIPLKIGENGISMPRISGEIIGFPAEVSFDNYFRWLREMFIPKMYKTFEKIDDYLRGEQEKNEKSEKVVFH